MSRYSTTGVLILFLIPTQEDCLRVINGIGPFVCGWGYGGVMNDTSRSIEPVEDRTVFDFDISNLSTISISNATLTFFIQNQQNGVTTSTVDVFIFYGESVVQTNDWNEGTYYQNFLDTYGMHSLNFTAAVKNAIADGQHFLDVKLLTVTDMSPCLVIDPPWQSIRLNLIINPPLIIPPSNLRVIMNP